MTQKRITIVLVEDHKIVRMGLRTLLELEDDFLVLGEAENGLEAVKQVQELAPMIVVMDIALPMLNGIEASRQILRSNTETKILMLSAYSDDGYIEKVTSLGVSGFLIKQCSPPLLIQAIREIINGKQFFSPEIAERLDQLTKIQLNNQGVARSKIQTLSERESQVLQLIAEGKSNKQVAHDLDISIKTVEKHRQNLMKKLSIHDIAGLTRYAITEGIIDSSTQRTRN